MRKTTEFILKLSGICIFLLIVLFFYCFQIPCVFKSVFGINCIMCGMTRAWLAALRLDFATAFSYHPMFWSVPILLSELFLNGKLFGRKNLDIVVIIMILIAILAVWITRLSNPDLFVITV